MFLTPNSSHLCVPHLEGSGDRNAISLLSHCGNVIFPVLCPCVNLLWPVLETTLLMAEEYTNEQWWYRDVPWNSGGTGMHHGTVLVQECTMEQWWWYRDVPMNSGGTGMYHGAVVDHLNSSGTGMYHLNSAGTEMHH